MQLRGIRVIAALKLFGFVLQMLTNESYLVSVTRTARQDALNAPELRHLEHVNRLRHVERHHVMRHPMYALLLRFCEHSHLSKEQQG